MAPDLPALAASLPESEFVGNERIEDFEFDLEELEAVIDAYETVFARGRRQSFAEYTPGEEGGLMARCPALEDMLGAMEASGEEECRQAGIFHTYNRHLARCYPNRSQRQFPSAELI